MEWGLQVAGNAGLSRLTIEINSQEVANFVNNKQGYPVMQLLTL